MLKRIIQLGIKRNW